MESVSFDLGSFMQITLPLCALFVWFVKRLDKKFEKIDNRFDKIEKRFDRLDETLREHGERLSFLEAANIYTMPIEAVPNNPRREAAKEMWRKRKAKKIENNS